MTRRQWRSPERIPPLPSAEGIELPAGPGPRLATGFAWRARALANALGHGLKRCPDVGSAHGVARRLDAALALARAFLPACESFGVSDPEGVVAARLAAEPVPWPESWAELAIADVVMGIAGELALDAVRDSSRRELAAAAGAVEWPASAFGVDALQELAGDARNRPCLQLLVDRWVPVAAHALGRPDSTAEPELLADRIKRTPAASGLRHLRERLAESLAAMGLGLPEADRAGIRWPAG